MVLAFPNEDKNDPARKIIEWIINIGINGTGFMPSAEQVSKDYRSKSASVEDAINSLIAWNTAYAAATGFVTGLGGIATLPIAIPADLIASYAIAASTVSSIAHLRGYDIQSEQVKTVVLLCLIGEAGEKILQRAGIEAGNKFAQNVIKKIPNKVLKEINKKVGFQLVKKGGGNSVIKLTKIVPLVGGAVGATFDAAYINSCGKFAKTVFP